MNGALKIVKIGGHVMDDPALLDQFLQQLAEMEGPRILVHGGGKTASEYLERLGIPPVMHNGRRITDEPTLEVVTMVYAGLINKQIVASLQAKNVNSLGMTGADLDLIVAHKRPVGEIDYGYAGDIDRVNSDIIRELLMKDVVPVICSITHDEKGQLLNTNADTIAARLGTSLAGSFPVHVIYCFEKDGVFKNVESAEIFDELDPETYKKAIKEGILTGGILPKLSNSFDAVSNGVDKVMICKYDQLKNWGTSSFIGTVITP